MPRQRALVQGRGITAVRLEPVRREVLGFADHQLVTRDLGNDRRRRHREHGLVGLHDRAHYARLRQVVVLAVEDDAVRFEALRSELAQRAVRRAAERLRHAELVALRVARVPDADSARPRAYTFSCDFAFLWCQQLRVAHTLEVLVTGYDRGDRHRSRPRAAPDLVDTDDDPIARAPQLPFDAQGWVRRGHCRGM